jgi:hypothetical protein
MNTRTILLTAALMSALAACGSTNNPPPESATAIATPAAPVTAAAPTTAIGRRVEQAMDQARAEMAANNLDISGGVNININGHKIEHSAGLTKAEITPQGDLLIAGKPVTVTQEQRALLLAYRGEVIDVASAGMTLGSQGADLGVAALTGLAGAVLGGEKGKQAYEQDMKAKGKRMESEALELCKQLPPMLATQQQLAASLPEFKPYATMTQQDIDECGKDIKAKGITVTDH